MLCFGALTPFVLLLLDFLGGGKLFGDTRTVASNCFGRGTRAGSLSIVCSGGNFFCRVGGVRAAHEQSKL